jgi:hypothetical protein
MHLGGVMLSIPNTYAQMKKWAVHNHVANIPSLNTAALPTSQNPNHCQNAAFDENGMLLFYAADGFVFDVNGDPIEDDTKFGVDFSSYGTNGHSEYIIIPVPQSCYLYYVISSGVLTVSSGINYDHALRYSIIDMEANNALGEFVPISGANASNELIFDESLEDCSVGPKAYHLFATHIAFTKIQTNGNRYLFVNDCERLLIYEVSNSGIDYFDEHDALNSNLTRTEMEIFENEDEIRLAVGILYSNYTSNLHSAIELFYFDKVSGEPVLNKQDVVDLYAKASSPYCTPRGIEYSPDGEFLYFTLACATLEGEEWYISDTHEPLRYFEYNSGSTEYDHTVNSCSILSASGSNHGYNMGMIEVGVDGGLWIAGNNRLGVLADANDPNSAFTDNAISITNSLTDGWGAVTSSANNEVDVFIYLLPDQVDGEDYELLVQKQEYTGPLTFYLCDFPFPFTPFPGGTFSGFYYADGSQSEIGEPIVDQETYYIEEPGTLKIVGNANGNGCSLEYFIDFIDYPALFDAGFDWGFSNFSTQYVELNITPYDNSALNACDIYIEVSSSWVYVTSSNNQSTHYFPGLDPKEYYKIEHEVFDPTNYCPLHEYKTSIVIYTGGQIKTGECTQLNQSAVENVITNN